MSVVLALTNLGIEQKGIVTCSNIIIKNGNLIVDPTFVEERGYQAKFQIACLVDLEEVILLINDGSLDLNTRSISEINNKQDKSKVDGEISLFHSEEFSEILANSLQICKVYHNYIMKQLA